MYLATGRAGGLVTSSADLAALRRGLLVSSAQSSRFAILLLRYCTNPAPANTGLGCTGSNTQVCPSNPGCLSGMLLRPLGVRGSLRYCAVFDWNGHSYQYLPATQTWDNARTAALAATYNGMKGYLVTIGSAAEETLVKNIILTISPTLNAWIGAYEMPADSATFKWADGPENNGGISQGYGASATAIGGAYKNWAASEPVAGKRCAKLNSNWRSESCGTTLGYLIEYANATEVQPVNGSWAAYPPCPKPCTRDGSGILQTRCELLRFHHLCTESASLPVFVVSVQIPRRQTVVLHVPAPIKESAPPGSAAIGRLNSTDTGTRSPAIQRPAGKGPDSTRRSERTEGCAVISPRSRRRPKTRSSKASR